MPRGSKQSNDVLLFEEFEYLLDQNETIKNKFSFETFHKAFKSLIMKVSEFGEVYLKSIKLSQDITKELNDYDNIVENYHEEIKEKENGKEKAETSDCSSSKQTKEYYEKRINIIIICKLFMIDLHSKGSEGSLIDIYSFMEKGPSSQRLLKEGLLLNNAAMGALKTIFNLSKLQSKEMDKIIIEELYNDHLHNRRLRKEYKNVIVEGAGTIGLYAAFKLFIGN
uniref:Uncharacterized protein n=1 Tax=Meloidogyne hapla TaxID=6305 RepID=A0A1I8BBC5_MELHA